jgi:hypothetical protein
VPEIAKREAMEISRVHGLFPLRRLTVESGDRKAPGVIEGRRGVPESM